MAEHATRVLLVDAGTDLQTCLEALQADGSHPHVEVDTASGPDALADALRRNLYDVYLVDCARAETGGAECIRHAIAGGCRAPIIALVAHEGDLSAVQPLESGTVDYLPKRTLDPDRLARAIRYAVERRRASALIEESEARKRAILETAIDSIVSIDAEGRITEFNPAAERTFGWRRDAIVGRLMADTIVPVSQRHAHREGFARHLATGQSKLLGRRVETTGVRSDGVEFPIELTIVRIDERGRPAFTAYIRDITERKAAELALQRSESRYRELVENAAYGIYRSTPDGRFLSANPALVAMLGYDSEASLLGLDIARDVYVNSAERADLVAEYADVERGPEVDTLWKRKDGRHVTVRLTGRPVLHDGEVRYFDMFVEDVTERRSLENQLLQSQKIETVGRLAGGIAHDFNNILTAVLGYSEMLLGELGPDDVRRLEVDEIRKAAARAAELTRQLLAFSRKQILQPVTVDLNACLTGVSSLLRRLLGEDVSIALSLDPRTSLVTVDPGQIEQVVINLAVNARDAMPHGGLLTIATRDIELDDAFAQAHIGAKAGPHVMLAVSDTGTGMPPDVVAKIFEPFFTTKGHEKGTGLGLATVYGIVKQSGGTIWVESEVNRGSTFTVYLPRSCEPVPAAVSDSGWRTVDTRHGGETILLVEDDPGVRALTHTVLMRLGYRVLSAARGDEALAVAQQVPERIHLLLTDVVMPQMSGRELALRLGDLRPDVSVLYMSGYTDDAIVHHGVLDEETAFLQKPFTRESLASAIRTVLDAAGERSAT